MKSPRLTLFLTTKSNTLLVKSVLMSKNGRSCKKWQKLKKNGRSWFVKSNSLFNSTSYMLADCLHPNFAQISHTYILYGDFSLIHFVWALLSHTFCMGITLSYILYGDFSHTFCMGISSTLRAPIRNTWASDLSYILCGDFSHTFCVGISLIHFVWGFCQLLELKRATFNSVDLAQP